MQNSSLVLTSENRTRDAHEPSGEPETLWGRMKGKMGDKALRAAPEGLDERKKKIKKKRDANREDDLGVPTKVRKAGNMSSVMDLDTAGARTPLPRSVCIGAHRPAVCSIQQTRTPEQPCRLPQLGKARVLDKCSEVAHPWHWQQVQNEHSADA